MKRIIYIGEADGNAIYFDTKKQIPLKAPKSKMLNTKKNNNSSRNIIIILGIILLLGSLGSIITIRPNILSGKYTIDTFILLVLLWGIEFLFLSFLVYRALYKNQNKLSFANSKEFGYAIRNNNYWNIFSNKKVTFWKKAGMFLLTVAFIGLTISIVPIAYAINEQSQFLGKAIGSEIIGISFLGIMPFVCVLFLWINNPVRWLNVVEKYQKRKIEYGVKNE